MRSSNLQAILDFLYAFGIVCCVMSIFIVLFKGLVNNDEMQSYIKKIKNSIIAMVLIITTSTIFSLFQGYYFDNGISDDTFGIGKIPDDATLDIINDDTTLNDNDKLGREVVIINGEKYVVTSRDKELYGKKKDDNSWEFINSWSYGYEKMNVRVDALKYFSDCQGFSCGADLTTKVQLYRIHKQAYDSFSGVDEKGKNGKKISEYLSSTEENHSKNTGYIINWHSYDEVKRDVESGDCYKLGL